MSTPEQVAEAIAGWMDGEYDDAREVHYGAGLGSVSSTSATVDFTVTDAEDERSPLRTQRFLVTVALVEPEECDNCGSTTDVDPASGLCPTCLYATEGDPR